MLEPLIKSIFALLSRPASYGPKGVVSRSIITLVGSAGFVIFRGLVRKAASFKVFLGLEKGWQEQQGELHDEWGC